MGKKGLFDLVKNVQPSETTTLNDLDVNNLNVDNLNITGLNLYEGNYVPGDVISYNYVGLMPAAKSLEILNGKITAPTIPAHTVVPSNLIASSYDIKVYELIYWGFDSRSSDTIRMSATLLIPTTIVDAVIVSNKHGTLGNVWQGYTLWAYMQSIINNNPVDMALLSGVSNNSWMFATTGYVVVCADNPGYGRSLGFYNFLDPIGESFSQYNALVATKQLITKESSLFPTPLKNVFGVPKFKVISSGYSLGGVMILFVSQLIADDSSFTLLNTIAGAPVNANKLLNQAIYDNDPTNTTPSVYAMAAIVYVFILLYANSNYGTAVESALKQNIVNVVLPTLNQLYLNTTSNIGLFGRNILKNTLIANGGNPAVFGPSGPNPATDFTVYPAYLFNASTTLEQLKEVSWYTNRYQDFSNLTGTPINVIYSLQDALCSYNPPTPYLGGGTATDNINTALTSFITTQNGSYGGLGNGNGLNRTNPADFTNTIVTPTSGGTIASLQVANTNVLISSESTNKCSSTRWETGSVGNLEHSTFADTVYQTVVRNYLIQRAA